MRGYVTVFGPIRVIGTGKEDGNGSFECPGNEFRFGQQAVEA